jgi:ankyrin repeat protein
VTFKGFADITSALLMAGAEVEADQDSDQTPLALAEMFGHNDVAEILKTAGGKQCLVH